MFSKRTIVGLGLGGCLATAAIAAHVYPLDTDGESQLRSQSPRNAAFVLDCSAAGQPISPLIYGVGGATALRGTTGTTARRWGGNPTTRYNWELNTCNLTKDWFFKNVEGATGQATRASSTRTASAASRPR